MNARSTAAIAVALATVTAGAGTAHAAKPKVKPVCNLVTDAAGDTFAFRSQDGTPAAAVGPKEDAFDVLSGDIASDGKTVTTVIRVKKLATSIQTSPEGAGYAFDFLLPTSDLQASMRAVLVNGQKPYFEVTYKDPSVPNSPSTFVALAKGIVDTKKNEIHISAPVAAFADLGPIKPGTVLQPAADAATSGRAVPPSPGTPGQPVATRYVFADVAAGGKTYKTGTPSCVVPGK
jgi:hypothetical protein